MQLLAQVINFLVIAGALSFLLYKPILRVLDERRERIRKSMEDTARIERQVQDLEKLRSDAMKALEKETGALMEQATKDAESLRQEIVASARKEADQIVLKARKQSEDERAKMLADAQQKLVKIIVDSTEKLLAREFSPADQQRIEGDIAKHIPSLIS